MNPRLVVALVGAGGVVIAAIIGVVPKIAGSPESSEIRYTVTALDNENAGIGLADISLNVGSVSQNEMADSSGKYTFIIDKSQGKKPVMVRIAKSGYKPTSKQVDLPPIDGGVTVRLEKLAPTPTAPPPLVAAVPATSPTEPLSPLNEVKWEPVTIEPKKSDDQLSGVRKDFSPWYDLCSDPVPPGTVITSHSFVLSGDRACGAWATCEPTIVKPDKVCYRFSLQGHDEWPGLGQAKSEGILYVSAFKLAK